MSFAVICSGQGAQTPDLFQRFPFSEKGMELQRRVLAAGSLEPEVAAWLARPTANPDAIFQNHFSQPLLCLFHLMVWAELSLPTPRLIAGYSLGELSTYGCSGALQPEDVVRLAGIRAQLMDSAGSGRLIAVTGLDFEAARSATQHLGGHLAIVLGADHCVIGGATDRSSALRDALLAAGAAEAIELKVFVPSHTPLLDAAVEPFRQALESLAWHSPNCPVLAGIDASKVDTLPRLQATLPEQIHRTVRWDLVTQRLAESNCRVVLELGPGRQLAHALLAVGTVSDSRAVEEFRTTEGVAAWLDRALERT
jgi:[acyl-carrier-protein] S-malonyltransferase